MKCVFHYRWLKVGLWTQDACGLHWGNLSLRVRCKLVTAAASSSACITQDKPLDLHCSGSLTKTALLDHIPRCLAKLLTPACVVRLPVSLTQTPHSPPLLMNKRASPAAAQLHAHCTLAALGTTIPDRPWHLHLQASRCGLSLLTSVAPLPNTLSQALSTSRSAAVTR